MKSLTSLWSCTANELAVRCCTSATRDITTVASRTEHEGLSFLAITLADYGKAFQHWLDQGFVTPSDVTSFKKDRRTGLPVFLRGFLGRVFCPVSGTLLENPDIEAIYAVRQLTLMYSKIALPQDETSQEESPTRVVSLRRERQAMLEYIQCEQDVRETDDLLDFQYMEDFKRIARLLYTDLFAKMDRDIHWGRLVPKHGPGAVADRISSNAKWSLRTWTSRLNSATLLDEEFLIPNLSFKDELRSELNVLEPGAEMPVKVITVPKTLKTPRIIAVEPAAMQYAQQSLQASLRDALEEDGFLSRIIGIQDQEPNRQLAMWGSRDGSLATLDLSEASDRVSNQHVLALLEDFPVLSGAVQACRSRKADVPGHGVIRLAKFASMGSALCFPIEAMVFTTLIFLGIERELRAPLTRRAIESYAGTVRVFGDDLIVPRDVVLSVVDELSTFGYRVNISKSYWTGRFRESCGREYFDGHDVSIVKVREVLPTRRQNASSVMAANSLRNQLYWAGLWRSAAWMDRLMGGLLKFYPNVAPSSPLLGRESALGYEFRRLHPYHHSPLTKGYYVMAKPPRDHLEGSGALLKCLIRKPFCKFGLPSPLNGDLNAVEEPKQVDGEHLERSGRPKRVSIKLGWRLPY
jgi:hypothetical protein